MGGGAAGSSGGAGAGGAGVDGGGGAGGSPADASADGPGSGGGAGTDAAAGGAGGPVCEPAQTGDVWASLHFTNQPGAVEAIAPGEIWGTADNGKLLRFHETDWTIVPPPFSWTTTHALVRGSSAKDIWLTDGVAAVARWDGQAWTDVSPAGLPPGLFGANITQLRVRSPSVAWLVSTFDVSAAPVPGDVQTSLPFRWDGVSWNAVALPAEAQPFLQIQELWITSANDVWLAGQVPEPQLPTSANGILLHWDGTALVSVPYGPQPASTGRTVYSVWASAANEVWVGGGSSVGATVDHFDGAAWTEVTFPRVYDYVEALWGWCTSNVWAATKYQGVMHFDGSAWTLSGGLQNVEPSEASGTGPSDVWISGNPSAVFHWQPNSCGDGVVGPGETCEPPNGTSCDSNCQSIPIVCGDGIQQPGEQCDVGPTTPAICRNCQLTNCGNCFGSYGGFGICSGLNTVDTQACSALVTCAANNMGWCSVNEAAACYCSGPTNASYSSCSAGADGPCAAQFQALSHSDDPTVVMAQINNPATPVGKVAAAVHKFSNSSCGATCYVYNN